MNRCFLVGRLTRNPESYTYTTNNEGKTMAKFSLATDRFGSDTADFHACVAFGKTAETIINYVKQGTKIAIEGTVQNNNYEKDGVKHYGYQIVVDKFEFCEKKAAADNQTAQAPAQAPDHSQPQEFMNVTGSAADEKLPFDE